MKKFLIGILAIILITMSGCSTKSSKPDIVLNDVHMNKMVHGLTKHELTLENLIEKMSDRILVGKIKGIDQINSSREVYKVEVVENIIGSAPNEILVYAAEENLLEIDKTFLFFLSDFSSTLYDTDFYVINEEFVIKVEENGELVRLEDVFKKSYTPPFVDKKYNNLNELTKYISNYSKQESKHVKKAKNKLENDELLETADHIIEIYVTETESVNNGLALVGYKINKKYKDGNFKDINYLLLPDIMIEEETYLLFLDNRESDSESVTLSTREGSIINKKSTEYKNITKLLNQKK